MSHIDGMSHGMAHVRMSQVTPEGNMIYLRIGMSHGTRKNESRVACNRTKSRKSLHPSRRRNESCLAHTYKRVMAHVTMSHGPRRNESRHTCDHRVIKKSLDLSARVRVL